MSRWSHFPGSNLEAPRWWRGDYVITQRGPAFFNVHYRPEGGHVFLGHTETLGQAKTLANKHRLRQIEGAIERLDGRRSPGPRKARRDLPESIGSHGYEPQRQLSERERLRILAERRRRYRQTTQHQGEQGPGYDQRRPRRRRRRARRQ